jgi:hypothetical protein
MRKSNIYCIGLWLPLTINLSIILATNCKQPSCRLAGGAGLALPSLSYPLSSKSYSLLLSNLSLSSGPAISNAFYTTINLAIFIIADKMGGYRSGPFYPSSATPNTANAHTNALSYSRRVTVWFNNSTQKSKHAF